MEREILADFTSAGTAWPETLGAGDMFTTHTGSALRMVLRTRPMADAPAGTVSVLVADIWTEHRTVGEAVGPYWQHIPIRTRLVRMVPKHADGE